MYSLVVPTNMSSNLLAISSLSKLLSAFSNALISSIASCCSCVLSRLERNGLLGSEFPLLVGANNGGGGDDDVAERNLILLPAVSSGLFIIKLELHSK